MPMNPQGGLASLVAALQGGMDPNQAFGITQYLEAEQEQRMAARAERLGGLASLLTNAAGQGLPYGAAQDLAEAQPGPAGNAVQSILDSLYSGAQPQNFEYQPEMSQQFPNEVASHQVPSNEEYQAQRMATQSPMYTQTVPGQMQELELQQAQAELMQPQMAAAADAQWGQLATLLAKAKSKGIDPATAYSSIVAKNPAAAAVFSSDPGRLQGIMESIFGQAAVKYAGQPTTG